MQEKAKLIQDLKNARQKMRQVVVQADPQASIYDLWKIKEVIDHLTGWDDLVVEMLEAHAAGEPPPTSAIKGIDYYNSNSVTTRGTLQLEHSIREWEKTRELVLNALLEMPDERFEEKMDFPWGGKGTTKQLIDIYSHHEQEHAKEIEGIIIGEG
jgi:hypothetical protein